MSKPVTPSRSGYHLFSHSARFNRYRVSPVQLLSGFVIAVGASVLLSCGSGHAVLQIVAPATVVAGVPFSATVTAMYQGKVDTVINGAVHFTTTDTAAHLPTLYVFTAADAGSHTFTDLTLITPGNQGITVSDYDATPITGSANIQVTAGPVEAFKQAQLEGPVRNALTQMY